MRRLTNLICWLLIIPISVFSQSRTLTGTITNSSGSPVPYATIEIKGTSSLTTADEGGNYSISVSGSNVILVVSSAGFTPREVNVGAASTYEVQLQEAGSLSEVVVTALGIKREKKALGYSAQEIKGEDLVASRQTNVVNALRGKVAGVQINSGGGAPGQGSRIIIRGIKSLDP
ncbi:MAG: carboxypeptidase-like regulatory domain-containing protein, partial [Chitinophagaceae bacterium]